MNERIKELLLQATTLRGPFIGFKVDQEKFAELIVKECADWVNDNVGLVDAAAKADLLKHFGVPE